MNFLAHAYLSFEDPEILVGNMVSDFVKGKARFGLSGKLGQGVILHRKIDSFTDSHPATRRAREIFRADYRLYGGAIMDVLYDHYLASDPAIFTEDSLYRFTQFTYRQLEAHTEKLPLPFLSMFTYMRRDNWLLGYRHPDGIRRSLEGLVRRAAYLTESATAFRLFTEHYEELGNCYRQFFPDVKAYAKEQFMQLI